jgi:signal transduction histidine kinase
LRERPATSKVRLGTDDNLRQERRLLDEILPERFPAATDTSARLDQVRRRTDLLLAGERAAVDELLGNCQSDLLEERRARRSADAAVVDRERLLATCGHDLRNLLNALALNTELSARQGQANARPLDNLRRTVGHMDKLISNMLDLARLKAGTFHVAFESRNAAEIVREAVEVFRPLAVAKSVSLNATLPDSALPVRIDPDRIFQVLSNLFSNAITATSEGGQVCVSAAKVDDVVQIAVRDSGRGMAETDLERVFDPYCQLDGSQRRGLGLGLFISRSIVQAHGGRVWAESGLDAGTTFFFTVPGVSPAEASLSV